MELTILPTCSSDAPSLAKILGLAYRNDARNQSILPPGITDEQREEFDAFRANMIRDRSSQPNRYHPDLLSWPGQALRAAYMDEHD